MKQIIKDFLITTIPIFLLTLLVGVVKIIRIKQEGNIYNKLLNFMVGCILGCISGYTATVQGLGKGWVIFITSVATLIGDQVVNYIYKDGLKNAVKIVNKKTDIEIEEPTQQINPPNDGK